MYSTIRKLEANLRAERHDLIQALQECAADPRMAEIARKLHCLNYLLQGVEFIAAEAVNAAHAHMVAHGPGLGERPDSAHEK